jgi:hypothetical protein
MDDITAFDKNREPAPLRLDRVSRENKGLADGMLLPTDPGVRKRIPIGSGLLDYFPLAAAYVALVSWTGNNQHNPGQSLHWARGKSADHGDCIPRHYIDRGTLDTDGMRHTGKLAWRALALLQEELEAVIANGGDPFQLTPEGKQVDQVLTQMELDRVASMIRSKATK